MSDILNVENLVKVYPGGTRAVDGSRGDNEECASNRRFKSCGCIPSCVCEHSVCAIRVPSGLGAGLFEYQPV